MRDFGRDFYGERMEVLVVGYIRPEMRFNGMVRRCRLTVSKPVLKVPMISAFEAKTL